MDMTIDKRGGSFYDNSIEGIEIENVTKFCDLGIVLNPKLHFSLHIAQIVAAAKKRIFLLFRSFVTKDPQALIKGFKTYILPLLNYCSPVWSPSTIGDIVLLETVQRNFTKRIQGCQARTYSDRLKALKLPTLELRRLRADLILCYKILNNLIPCTAENFGLILSERQSRGHSKKLAISHVRIDVRKNFFGCRVCAPWNALPDNIVNANSINTFKRLLWEYNLNKFCCFTE